jgi:hypothetical protein
MGGGVAEVVKVVVVDLEDGEGEEQGDADAANEAGACAARRGRRLHAPRHLRAAPQVRLPRCALPSPASPIVLLPVQLVSILGCVGLLRGY